MTHPSVTSAHLSKSRVFMREPLVFNWIGGFSMVCTLSTVMGFFSCSGFPATHVIYKGEELHGGVQNITTQRFGFVSCSDFPATRGRITWRCTVGVQYRPLCKNNEKQVKSIKIYANRPSGFSKSNPVISRQ